MEPTVEPPDQLPPPDDQPAPSDPPGLVRDLAGAAPMLVSLALLMLGTSMHTSVLGLRGPAIGFATVTLGAILSGYYLGFLVGSSTVSGVITAVGHVRSFAGLAAALSAAVLLHAVWSDPLVWWLLRLVAGMCISGLFVVAESWLNGTATNATRGRLLAAYMVVMTAAIGGGQLLLTLVDPLGFGAFVLASVLVSASVVPISLMPASPPVTEEPMPLGVREVVRAAPLAVVGAAASGFTCAAAIGAGAVYGSALGLPVNRIAVLLAAVLAGALVLQFPLGLLSDRVDRRRVIAASVFVAAGASVLAALLGADRYGLLVLAAAVAGGTGYPLYAMSNAHLNDWLEPGAVVAAGARMVLINGMGAVAGPFGATVAIDRVGPEGFFGLLAVVYVLTGCFALYRITRRAPAPVDQRSAFSPLPPGSAPTLAGLSPDAADELHPVTEHHEPVGGMLLRWRERGSGHPVVLVHDAGSSCRAWDEVQLRLADHGHHVVAHDLRGHGSSGSARAYGLDEHLADLGALLDHLGFYPVTLVGHGGGASLAARYALEQPGRVDALVLVSPEHDLVRRPGQAARRVADRSVQAAARSVLGRRAAGSLGASASVGRRRNPSVHRRLAADLATTRRPALGPTRRGAHRAAQGLDPLALRPPTLWIRGGHLRPRPDDPSSLVVVPGAGHYVHLEQPAPVADAIATFVALHGERAIS